MRSSEWISIISAIIAFISAVTSIVAYLINVSRDKNKVTIKAVKLFENKIYPKYKSFDTVYSALSLIKIIDIWALYITKRLANRKTVDETIGHELNNISNKYYPIEKIRIKMNKHDHLNYVKLMKIYSCNKLKYRKWYIIFKEGKSYNVDLKQVEKNFK